MSSDYLKSPIELVRERFHENGQIDLIQRRLRSNQLAMVGLGITIGYILIAIVGPYFVPYDPAATDYSATHSPPSLAHPFGTDELGRDVLSRTIAGARISLEVAIAVVAFSSLVGVTLGLIAGFYRGWIEEVIMRVQDVMFAFPSILLALVIIAILGTGLQNTILALGIGYTPVMIRITRGSALSVREEEYVMAAISYGESSVGIMFRDMLPNLISAVMVQATLTFAFTILAEASLSFLGLSAQPPTPTWGVLISTGRSSLTFAPWVSVFPGLAIMTTVLGLTFLGVGLRDAFDPKTDVNMEQ